MLRPNEQAQHRVFAASHLLTTARVISFAVTANYRHRTPLATKFHTAVIAPGMWTRFFPAVKKARELIAAGAIGEPVLFQADFGFCGNPETQDRVFNPALGGGALLDIGIYPIAAASLCFRCSAPVEVKAVGTLGASGVDEIGSLALQVRSWLHAWPQAQASKHARANKHRHQCAAQQIEAVGLQASHHHPHPHPLHSHSHTHTYTRTAPTLTPTLTLTLTRRTPTHAPSTPEVVLRPSASPSARKRPRKQRT
jgi:predicted dehydrogenase